jgi:hypothetical protein
VEIPVCPPTNQFAVRTHPEIAIGLLDDTVKILQKDAVEQYLGLHFHL